MSSLHGPMDEPSGRPGRDGAVLRVLIAEEDPTLRDLLVTSLARSGFAISAPAVAAQCVGALGDQDFDIVILDLRTERAAAVDALRTLRRRGDDLEIIVVTGQDSSSPDGVAEIEAAFWIAKPFPLRALIELVSLAARHRRVFRDNLALRRAAAQQESSAAIHGDSEAIASVRALLGKAGRSRSHTLIQGEHGTGKALAARILHRAGDGGDLPFLAVDCGLPGERLEAELFGLEHDARSGGRPRHGLLELAHRGTLFLEEVAELSLATQNKLLRAVDRGEIQRVGGERGLRVDARVVAATSVDLGRAVAQGQFRADLYYRLGAVVVTMPPLRERVEDIPVLAEHFVRALGHRPIKLSSEALALLGRYRWPGNVRELRNVIERMSVLAPSDEITAADVSAHLPDPPANAEDMLLPLDEVERRHILRVLHRTGFNRARTAKILGVDPKTLYNKLKGYGASE